MDWNRLLAEYIRIYCTHRPSDPVAIGDMIMPTGHAGRESKLKVPEKRKMSKRPYSYLAAMDTPNG